MTYDLPSDVLPMFGGKAQDVNSLPSDVTMFGKPGLAGVSESTPVSQPMPSTTPVPPATYMPQDKPDKRPNFIKFMEGFGAGVTGQVPMPLKIRAAELENKYREAQIAEGWANYHKTTQLADMVMQKHDQDMQEAAWEYLPKARAYLDTIPLNTPERKVAEDYTRKIMRGIHPDGLIALDSFIKDPVSHYAANLLLKDSPEAQQLFESQGPAFYDTEFAKRRGAILGQDMSRSLMSRLDKQTHDKISTGKLSQIEFQDSLYKAAVNPEAGKPVSPQELQFIKSFLVSPSGDTFMAGIGVPLAEAAKIQQEKHAAMPRTKQAQDERFMELESRIKTGETLNKDEQDEYNILLGTRAKNRDLSQPQGPMDRFLINASKGQMQSFADLAEAMRTNPDKMPLYAAWSAQAIKDYQESPAQGRMQVGQRTPEDISKKDVFEVSALVNDGKLVNVKTPITRADLTSGKYITLEKADKSALQQLAQSSQQGHQLFRTATQLFKAKTSWDVQKQQAVANDIKYFGWAGAAARHDPAWQVYMQGLNAWASTDARTLGTERGVMTNTDIDRWVATFPNPSDTEASTKAKIALFDKMLTYVLKTNIQIMAGTLDLLDPEASKKNMDTIQGFIGNAEQFTSKTKSSKSETTGQERKSAAESLLERMTQ